MSVPGTRWLAAVGLLAAGLGLGGGAEASCTLKAPPLKSEVLDRYEKTPKSMLRDFPTGGYGLLNIVSQLTARKVENVALIFNVAVYAKADQEVAIAIGLYKTASGCQAQDSKIAKAIDRAIAKSGQDSMVRAYNLALGDTAPSAASATQRIRQPAPQELPQNVTAPPGLNDPFAPLPDPFGPPAHWQ